MKKVLVLCLTMLLILSACFTFSSCNASDDNNSQDDNKSNTEMTMKRYYVSAKYNDSSNTYALDLGQFVLANNIELHSKINNKKLSNCIVGDYLEVYYSNSETTVEKVIVDEAKIIKLTKLSIPGEQPDGRIDLIAENNQDMIIRHDDVFYVMNANGSITKKQALTDETIIYGVYREEDILVREDGLPPIYSMVGLYSYNPRYSE